MEVSRVCVIALWSCGSRCNLDVLIIVESFRICQAQQRLVLEMAKKGLTEAEVEALEWPVDSSGETNAALIIDTSQESRSEGGEVGAPASLTHFSSGGGPSLVEPPGGGGSGVSATSEETRVDEEQHFQDVEQAVEALHAGVTPPPEPPGRAGCDVGSPVTVSDAEVSDVDVDEGAVRSLAEEQSVVAVGGRSSGVGAVQCEGSPPPPELDVIPPLHVAGVGPRDESVSVGQRIAASFVRGRFPMLC